jgi:predicted alpha/beta superfamily hydrolase
MRQGPDAPIVLGQVGSLWSSALQEERRVFVYLPPGYDRAGRHYPVLYVLDGDACFHDATGIVHFMSRADLIPELIVIGVTNTHRSRDLTPPGTSLPEGPFSPWGGTASEGGADAFLRFMADELVPWVGERYRTEPFRILSGHSFGGVFCLYALANRPDVFPVQIAASSSLWLNRRAFVGPLAQAMGGGAPSGFRFISLSCGTDEALDFPDRNIPESNLELVRLLERTPGLNLEWHYRVYEGCHHSATPHRSLYDGLELLFNGWRPHERVRAGDPAGVEQHYRQVSKKYGYSVLPPCGVVNAVGYALLRLGRAEQALAVFQHNARAYAEQSPVYWGLGYALETLGQFEAALAAYQRALQLALESGDHHGDPVLTHRLRVESLGQKMTQRVLAPAPGN